MSEITKIYRAGVEDAITKVAGFRSAMNYIKEGFQAPRLIKETNEQSDVLTKQYDAAVRTLGDTDIKDYVHSNKLHNELEEMQHTIWPTLDDNVQRVDELNKRRKNVMSGTGALGLGAIGASAYGADQDKYQE